MACILVVDDDVLFAAMVSVDLEAFGHRALIAHSAAVAVLTMATGEPIDLIISDIFMPEMDGIELIQALRAEYPSLPIVAVSSGRQHLGSTLFTTARLLGANAVLQKPFGASALGDVVDRLLGSNEAGTADPRLIRAGQIEPSE